MNEYCKIEALIYADKNFKEAKRLIATSLEAGSMRYQKLLADAMFFANNFIEASKIYNLTGDFYKAGYCYFILKEIDLAIEFFYKSAPSPAQNWNLFLAEIFRARVNTTPTYLQIRAFLERDLSLFLHLDIVSYVQKSIDISEYLFSINPETNKFIARAFLNNNYPDYAKEYIDMALDFTTKDAELYYLLAKYYQTQGVSEKVKSNLEEAIRLSESFVPAKIMLEKIS